VKGTRVCPGCGRGHLASVNDIVSEFGGYVFAERGERCDVCGEEFPFEEEVQRTIEGARRMGVWPEPLKLYRKLSKSGRSLVLRIPSDLEKQMHLDQHTKVAIAKAGNRIVVEIEKTEKN